ncbi:hypothetical protein [Georgenia ruanii]|uniref:hypothetical protein n=1 Tax=Georgenia ruanii TaxID=348442 RepID=UPI0012655AFA|nr:hypothetical protein [Georgenia ruanii]
MADVQTILAPWNAAGIEFRRHGVAHRYRPFNERSAWLTFEPRRLRVYGSKVLAPGLGIAPAAAAGAALWLAALGALAAVVFRRRDVV